jgi:hypothetical protein
VPAVSPAGTIQGQVYPRLWPAAKPWPEYTCWATRVPAWFQIPTSTMIPEAAALPVTPVATVAV